MKKHLLVAVAAFAFLTAGTSCNSSSSNTAPEETEHAQHQTAAPNSASAAAANQMAYICPMECEGSPSMEPGKCPVCGMDLVKNPAYQASPDSTAAKQ